MRMREYTAMNNNKSYLQSHTFVNILKIQKNIDLYAVH